METLAYPHMTLAHNPQSDPPRAIAPVDQMLDRMMDTLDALPTLMTGWFRRTPSGPSSLSSAGWMAVLGIAIATSTWVVGSAAIAQTPSTPGNSGLSFTSGADQPEAEKTEKGDFQKLPEFQIDNEPPKSLAQWLNEGSGGFLKAEGVFRDDVRRPAANSSDVPQTAKLAAAPQNAPPRSTGFAVPTPVASAPVSAYRFGNLRYRMRSPQVAQLQTQLYRLGFFQGRSDGFFGNNTLNAVRAFQKSRGLKADGIVGPTTRAALYGGSGSGGAPLTYSRRITPVSSTDPCARFYTRIGHREVSGRRRSHAGGCTIPCVGSKNQNVVALQNRLKTLGYFKFHTSTGYYGPITEHAVKRYQRAKGLRPDGIAGPLTKKSLGLNF